MTRLAVLRARALEAQKRCGDLLRWSRGVEASTSYAAGVRVGLKLASRFVAQGLFGPSALCLHDVRANETCPTCDADARELDAETTEEGRLEVEAARRAARLEDLLRRSWTFQTVRPNDPEARNRLQGIAWGLSAARTYLERGVFLTLDVPEVDAASPRKAG